jgi:hypothetical protein
MPSRAKIVVAVLIVAAIGVSTAAVLFFRHMGQVVDDCYMQEHVAYMLIEHMERNGGAWPRSWDDLEEARETREGSGSGQWSATAMQERCRIDFAAKPADLVKVVARADEPPFLVVWLSDGARHHWSGGEPNRILYDYLKRTLGNPEGHRWKARPVPGEREARKALLARGATWRLNDSGHVVFVDLGSFEGQPRFSDDDLQHVAELAEIGELILGNSAITNEGLRHLQSLERLRKLDLSGTQVTDGGLRLLAPLQGITGLSLAFDRISDQAMPHLMQLSSLRETNLNFTNVSDAGVRQLCTMEHLEDIQLGDTLVTAHGAELIKAQFPNARLYWSTRDGEGKKDR